VVLTRLRQCSSLCFLLCVASWRFLCNFIAICSYQGILRVALNGGIRSHLEQCRLHCRLLLEVMKRMMRMTGVIHDVHESTTIYSSFPCPANHLYNTLIMSKPVFLMGILFTTLVLKLWLKSSRKSQQSRVLLALMW